jgi:glucosamine--fructose-6-phosphate aminotransferase (isomerizing)
MKEDLVSIIKELGKNKELDCLLMFSGGKDSSYLLYFLSQELGLNVATFTLTHNFLAKETLNNIESFAKRYSKKHITVENSFLNHAGQHFLETWINRPDEESLITLCTGCRLGLIKLVIETAKKENINVVITGLTPFEATDYRVKLVNYPKGKDGRLFFLLGYLRLILRNPSLILNYKALKYQTEEFYYYSKQKEIYRRNNIHLIKPFYDYLKYDESIIIETLKKLNWQKASISSSSYWWADCDMNAIRQYFHNKISGYNEQKYYYGQMLRDNLITKEYYEANIKSIDQTEGITNILRSSGISARAMKKYESFL